MFGLAFWLDRQSSKFHKALVFSCYFASVLSASASIADKSIFAMRNSEGLIIYISQAKTVPVGWNSFRALQLGYFRIRSRVTLMPLFNSISAGQATDSPLPNPTTHQSPFASAPDIPGSRFDRRPSSG